MIRLTALTLLLLPIHAQAEMQGLQFDAEGMLIVGQSEGGRSSTRPEGSRSSTREVEISPPPSGPFVISAAERAVWVADSVTGRVRVCGTSSLNAAPKCSPWSAE